MIRNLKALGLALVAVFAMSAIAASAASADVFTAESYPVTVTGGDDPGVVGVTRFDTTAGSVTCPQAKYDGTLSGASTTLLLTPTYGDCLVAGSIPAIVDTNGCHFLLHIGTGSSTAITTTLTCPVGKDITVTVNDETTKNLTTKCTLHVPPQTVSGLTVDTVGAGTTQEIRLTSNASGLTYTETAGTGLGACATSVQQHGGNFVGTDLLTGEVDGGTTHVGLTLSENPLI